MNLNTSTFRSFVILFILTITLSDKALSQLYINEIIASNQAGQQDDFLNNDDWIEIFNDGGVVNMAGYYITDDPDSLTKYMIPFGFDTETFLAPNSHFIIWADNEVDEGPTHSNFSLSADGETILLVAPDGTTIIDQISYPLMATDISYGRETDGNANWMYFNNVTFEDPNGELVQPQEILFINEVQTLNSSTFQDTFDEYEQWFEIYNPNPYPVNVAGYFISNTANPLEYLIPNTNPYRTLIPANGFVLIWCDGETIEDSNHSSFTLNNAGGTITLTAPDGSNIVDSYTYPALGVDESWGRSSDGGVNSIVFDIPTPRVSNQIILVEPALVYINEVLTININDTIDNYLEHEDWFEIYNPGNTPVSLVGYYFSDNPENSMKWQVPATFPDSVTVPAQGWLLFWADEDAIQGVRHASFRLNNAQEELTMYSPDGFTVVDQISWVGMDADTSLGRATDGSPNWIYFISSTPEYSNNSGEIGIFGPDVDKGLITLWPNPANTFVLFSERSDIEIYSVNGQLIRKENQITQLDISDISAGLYFVKTSKGQVVRLTVH
jgi:Lamin Tail Domain/Secretion system C-terminal sorting domain